MKIRAYRWYGGKIRMVDKLDSLIPEHKVYCEPFMGSAALLLNQPRSEVEVVNDLDEDIYCFMKTLADREKGKVLVEKLRELHYGKKVFKKALECKKRNFAGLDEIGRAAMVYVLITQSFNCKRKSYSTAAFKDDDAYREDIEFHIPQVYERLEGVRIENRDAVEILHEIADDRDAFAFVDPPYRHDLRGKNATKVYGHEMSDSEQVRFLDTIKEAKCKIMIGGYRSQEGVDLYDRYLLPLGWKCYKLGEYVKACQRTKNGHKDMAEEFIWVNYELPKCAEYVISLKEYSSLNGGARYE